MNLAPTESSMNTTKQVQRNGTINEQISGIKDRIADNGHPGGSSKYQDDKCSSQSYLLQRNRPGGNIESLIQIGL